MTTPKEHEVDGCGDCPYAHGQWMAEDCQLTERDVDEYIQFGKTTAPDWCPLREGPITVRLRK